MDAASFFADKWDKEPEPQAVFTFQGRLCGVSEKNGIVSAKLLVHGDAPDFVQSALDDRGDGTVFVKLTKKPTQVEIMDLVSAEACTGDIKKDDGRVFLSAHELRRAKPWKDYLANNGLAKEHVEMPQEGPSPVFMLYSGTTLCQDGPVGLHRKVHVDTSELTWTTKGKEVRRLTVYMTQRQWKSDAELHSEPEPLNMKMYLWEDHCAQLGLTKPSDLDSWKALMGANCDIPFYALVRVDQKYSSSSRIALATLGMRWDLATYLSKCVVLSRDVVRRMYPKYPVARVPGADVFNVTIQGKIPEGAEWRFHAITSDPTSLTTEGLVEENAGRATIVVIAVAGASAAGTLAKKQKK